MDALIDHVGEGDACVRMDIAMVEQHNAAATTHVEFETWSKTFRESLKQIGKALLVLI